MRTSGAHQRAAAVLALAVPSAPSTAAGWLAYRRVGSDAVTATALRVHTNA